MSFDDILKKIEEDSEAEASRIIREAESRARDILREAELEAGEKSGVELRKAEAEAEEEKRRILAMERLEVRRRLLMAKQEAVDEVYRQVLTRMRELADEDYLALVRKTILEAVETGTETVVISPQDRERITPDFLRELDSELDGRSLSGSLSLEIADVDLEGGVLLKGEGTEVNCTFAQLLDAVKEEMEPKVMALLFPREESS
ncbi:MAG: V-type ATP synthase subunit E [Actinomycetota bacterium]|nr:V-type ATP synthase subunit E [Actinomycetota bacterium]